MIKSIENNKMIIMLGLVLYMVYMLRYFKTKYNFAHPLTSFDNQYFKHPIGRSDKRESKICKFGREGVIFLAIILLLKEYLYKIKFLSKNNYYNVSRIIYLSVFTLSFANFNALIYLIPYFMIELYYFL